MTGLLIDNINKMKRPIIKMGLLTLASTYLLTGCTQQDADNMAFKNGQPNSVKMLMDLSEVKELSASLSKNWDKVNYNKKGITTLKEENIVLGVKDLEFTADFLVNYEKSIYPKDYIAFAQKRGNSVKKYNNTINKKGMDKIDPYFSITHFSLDMKNSYQGISNGPFYIEYDKDGRVVSALGSYVYKSGRYDVRADCYHTYFSGAKAKIIETIFTKKELEENLAF